MSDAGQAGSETPVSVRLHVARVGRADINAALVALTDLSWLGSPRDGPADQPGVRRIATDLELPILDGSTATPVRKAALIDVGPPRIEGGEVILTVAWHSATYAPLFPVFAGNLRVSTGELVVDGWYVPPFGRIGLLIDATLLHFVARRTAHAFLGRIAARFAP